MSLINCLKANVSRTKNSSFGNISPMLVGKWKTIWWLISRPFFSVGPEIPLTVVMVSFGERIISKSLIMQKSLLAWPIMSTSSNMHCKSKPFTKITAFVRIVQSVNLYEQNLQLDLIIFVLNERTSFSTLNQSQLYSSKEETGMILVADWLKFLFFSERESEKIFWRSASDNQNSFRMNLEITNCASSF